MKTYKNLYEEICSFENLHLAYLKARKGKRYRNEILEFSYNLEENLLKLQTELRNQTYKHGSYREFIVCDSKKRLIKAAPFRDRVVHHALCNIIEPIFEKGFIYDSYACREGKGTHKAIKRVERFWQSAEDSRGLDEKDLYCLQCDVSKYFDSIDHKTLLAIIKRKIIDGRTLCLIEKIINSDWHKKVFENLFEFRFSGIPIGNLTSQLFANIYLNELDRFVKHSLREKFYVRYMDDFLILSFDKRKLQHLKKVIKEFLTDCLALTLHPKKANIFPISKGIDFLGYRIFRQYKLLRKSTVRRFVKRTKRFRKKLQGGKMAEKKFDDSVRSWLTYAKFGDTRGLLKDMRLIICGRAL
ncbi:MAG: reverse transcriptase/maturase family protein [Candidatus Pacebacteria bacterium]|jgi:retron-type reverse transcriptase|nr:reverse transcriptase/maturase family protein [Candidatus Paceibacterota bacterium]